MSSSRIPANPARVVMGASLAILVALVALVTWWARMPSLDERSSIVSSIIRDDVAYFIHNRSKERVYVDVISGKDRVEYLQDTWTVGGFNLNTGAVEVYWSDDRVSVAPGTHMYFGGCQGGLLLVCIGWWGEGKLIDLRRLSIEKIDLSRELANFGSGSRVRLVDADGTLRVVVDDLHGVRGRVMVRKGGRWVESGRVEEWREGALPREARSFEDQILDAIEK